MEITRRDALKLVGTGAGVAALAAAGGFSKIVTGQEAAPRAAEGEETEEQMGQMKEYVLAPLPYDYNALEPVIDERTLRLHHDKHHASYVKGANTAMQKLAEARSQGDFEHVRALERDLAFNGSGVILHDLYWNSMRPAGGPAPQGELAEHIKRDFGSVDAFKAQFAEAGKSVTGSGWSLLGLEPALNKLMVLQVQTHEHQTIWGVQPLLVMDVWEHAYYLQYQNNRGDYVQKWADLIDWEKAAARYARARGQGGR